MIQLAHAVHRPCPSIYVCGNKIVIVTIIIKRGIKIIPPRGFQRTHFSEKRRSFIARQATQVRRISLSLSLSLSLPYNVAV